MQGNSGRRRFLALSLRTVAGVAIGSTLFGLYLDGGKAVAAPLRPPGSLPEEEFLGSCLRCGLCAKDCPYDAIRMATPGSGVAIGTPYIEARKIPCYMCEDIPCLQACPTGAMDKGMKQIEQARMGLAVLHDQESCLAYLGQRCEVCYRACPLLESAMTIEYRPLGPQGALFLPTVHAEACTGCGFCEHVCILDEPAIKVYDITIVKGERGPHYRKEMADETV